MPKLFYAMKSRGVVMTLEFNWKNDQASYRDFFCGGWSNVYGTYHKIFYYFFV
ncbi:hypothetical protein [Holospora curviuscula]|uniref:Uncharacterized protein n=1 Tax=Holospora curviuscula TaxID=1082868 RepID=A0A2S5R9D8_9PROT|nr:hypothetical protein [Holospora curviuscula]PPE03917.1 hypothetical protein HCUR_00697 [Holospora curviuscula]